MDLLREVIKTLLAIFGERDEYYRYHCERVGRLSSEFAKYLENIIPGSLSPEKFLLIGFVHDLGMVYVPDSILFKTESLDQFEFLTVRKHPEIGEKILSNITLLKDLLHIIKHHHESFDGTGYPGGLKGDDIPFGARVIRIIDSYDAMISVRAYRPAFSIEHALEKIVADAGVQFDPFLAHCFVDFIMKKEKISKPIRYINVGAAKVEQPDKWPTIYELINFLVNQYDRGLLEPPILPESIEAIKSAISSPHANSETVSYVIERDAVVSLKFMAIANSAFYKGVEKSYAIKNIISRMGLSEVSSVISAIAMKNEYTIENSELNKMLYDVWLHSVATAELSRYIASNLSLENPDSYYMMGLIHDVGKVYLIRSISEMYAKGYKLPFNEAINAIHKTHQTFGGIIMEKQVFSGEFAHICKNHGQLAFDDKNEDKALYVVHLANILTRNIGFSTYKNQVDVNNIVSALKLGVNANFIRSAENEVKKIMAKVSLIFDVAGAADLSSKAASS